MNKVFSVNIGGMVFTVDDLAYNKLSTYLDSIKAHFSNTEGREEIISDIESRIAEMLKERMRPGKDVIGMDDIDYIISLMGKPEDFSEGESDEQNNSAGANYNSARQEAYTGPRRHRLFRDPDNKLLGGVCSGIASYFGMDDPIWIRLAFVLIFFTFGTGLLLYIILWVIIPIAKTMTDRMEMRGEDVTINNIKKNIGDEVDGLKQNFNSFAESVKNKRYDGAMGRVQGFLYNVASFFARAIGKILAFIAVIIGLSILVLMMVTMFANHSTFADFPHFISDRGSHRLMMLCIFLLLGIPFLALLIKGVRTIFNIRFRSHALGKVLFAAWFIGVFLAMYMFVSGTRQFRRHASIEKEYSVGTLHTDSLHLSLNKETAGEPEHLHFNFNFDDEDDDDAIIRSNGISFLIRRAGLKVERSPDSLFHIREIISSRGKNTEQAKANAARVTYNYKEEGKNLILDRYCSFPKGTSWRNQKVRVILEVPAGKTIYFDANMRHFLDDVPNVTDTYDEDMLGHFWKMTPDGLKSPDTIKERHSHTHHNGHNQTEDEDDDDNSGGKVSWN